VKLVQMSVEGFLDELASDSPAPGGGSVAALAGAAAAALCAMVARLTLGREKLRAAWPAMERLLAEADGLGARLRRLVDEDTEAYATVVAARRMPRATEAERSTRGTAIAEAALRSARVPLETLAALQSLSGLAAIALEQGNPACLTDAGSAAALVRAAAAAASWNVRVNLPDIVDPEERSRLAGQAAVTLSAIEAETGELEKAVDRRLG
jgi:glutamate formiminotransferase/formiminotetrahydrofolate cyclodeaminase